MFIFKYFKVLIIVYPNLFLLLLMCFGGGGWGVYYISKILLKKKEGLWGMVRYLYINTTTS